VAGSSRESWARCALFAALALVAACSVGHGSGEVEGTLMIENCRTQGHYALVPNAFFAQAAEQLLKIRIQRGGDIEVRSDGVAILVEDATQLRRSYLGSEITLGGSTPPHVELTAYFNDTCPPGRDKTPVVLNAVSGTIRFDAIYAPQVDADDVHISGELRDVRFEDRNHPEARWALLGGRFDFLYVRGSPAQPFP
jgi:hypothetical protein